MDLKTWLVMNSRCVPSNDTAFRVGVNADAYAILEGCYAYASSGLVLEEILSLRSLHITAPVSFESSIAHCSEVALLRLDKCLP